VAQSKSAVYIATNQGPVRIMRITEAPELKLSVALVSQLSKKASISDEYHDFVCLDTGVIAHHTLVDRYELQLEKNIEPGRGWQLGIYIGHQLFHQQNLAVDEADGAECNSLIVATGEVGRDSNVRPVKDIGDKLRSAERLIRQAQDNRQPVTFYFPQQNLSTSETELLQEFRERYWNLQISSVHSLEFDNPLTHATTGNLASPETQPESGEPPRFLRSLQTKIIQALKRRFLWWSAIITLPSAAIAFFLPADAELPDPEQLSPQVHISASR
jgi:hypothetical protein